MSTNAFNTCTCIWNSLQARLSLPSLLNLTFILLNSHHWFHDHWTMGVMMTNCCNFLNVSWFLKCWNVSRERSKRTCYLIHRVIKKLIFCPVTLYIAFIRDMDIISSHSLESAYLSNIWSSFSLIKILAGWLCPIFLLVKDDFNFYDFRTFSSFSNPKHVFELRWWMYCWSNCRLCQCFYGHN